MKTGLLRRPSHLATLACGSLMLALLLAIAAPSGAGTTGSVSKLRKCKGADAEAVSLRTQSIACAKALRKVARGNHRHDKDCPPGIGQTCRSRVAGFKCKHRGTDAPRSRYNPEGIGVLITANCNRKVRKKNGKRVKQTVRWQSVFAG